MTLHSVTKSLIYASVYYAVNLGTILRRFVHMYTNCLMDPIQTLHDLVVPIPQYHTVGYV